MLPSFNAFKAIVALAAMAVPCAALNYNISLNSQTRLAYSGVNGMTVSWNTYRQIENPTVLYGLDPNNLVFSASSTVSVTYNTSLTYNNHVQLENLLPDTVYYYMPTTLMNPEPQPYSFKTSLPAGIATPFSVAVVIDMGTFGPEGLSTSAGTGVAPNNILKPGEANTIQSLVSELDDFEFLWHRKLKRLAQSRNDC
jgi:acid phosphatase type 7